jgi:hypothetical protein
MQESGENAVPVTKQARRTGRALFTRTDDPKSAGSRRANRVISVLAAGTLTAAGVMIGGSPAFAGQSCVNQVDNRTQLLRDCMVDTYDHNGNHSGMVHIILDWEADGPGGSRRANLTATTWVQDTLTNGYGERTIVNAHVAGTPTDNSGTYVTIGDAYAESSTWAPPGGAHGGGSSAAGFDFVYVNWGDAHNASQYNYVGTEKIFGP